ncbi:hypothetical protein EV363DRAFT_1163964 [Boletus edulis]|nr:hypothetical protein EV363DRAFT_1163964 [Boletus edulis]
MGTCSEQEERETAAMAIPPHGWEDASASSCQVWVVVGVQSGESARGRASRVNIICPYSRTWDVGYTPQPV